MCNFSLCLQLVGLHEADTLQYIIKIILKCLNSTKQNGMKNVYFPSQLFELYVFDN
jgi:hypothetical protein